jgi:hypothetical protein
MLKRIRYQKTGDTGYICIGTIKNVDSHEFIAGYSADGKIGFIKSVGDDTTKITLQATSPHKVKIKIKKALIKLGCQFDSEKRKPRITDEA